MRQKTILIGALILALGLGVWGVSVFLRGNLSALVQAAPPSIDEPISPESIDEERSDVASNSTGSELFETPAELRGEDPPRGVEREFSTDFSIHSVSYREILSGGPPKDGIPSIDNPKFVSIEEADAWLRPKEPVVLIELNGEARAYPIQILTWHEIVNTEVGGVPVAVTFCPLCNTAIAFERTVDRQVLDFGTTGRLRNSNLIMYDRQTESWWQQAGGNAIAGVLTGTQLEFAPAPMVAWEAFKANHPGGKVLSRETGFGRSYGSNPYAGYDDIDNSPFLFNGVISNDQLPPMARVLTIDLNGEAVAYPYQVLSEVWVVNDTVGDQPVVVFWSSGTESAFRENSFSNEYEDVGTANSFSPVVDGEELTFQVEGDAVVDNQTGSHWNVLGEAVSGPLAGTELEPVVSVNHFWFSWAAFKPETRVFTGN